MFLIFTIQLYDSAGTYPKNLLASTIISIPKDMRASLCKSDNYRGISLFNAICKVFDYVIMYLYDDFFTYI